jgi:thioester reductase-like protein
MSFAHHKTLPIFNPERTVDELVGEHLPPLAEGHPRRILLTGATGFVGSHLVRHLAGSRETILYCLVRAATEGIATERMRTSLDGAREYTIGRDGLIRVIPGDLSKSSFGLTDTEFMQLADMIDAIVHVGAAVNVLRPYAGLDDTNVGGTGELIRLAVTNRLKPVHYISTASADFAEQLLPTSGYAKTKWHGELLVEAAQARKVPTAIYRLPRIAGEARTGRWNDRDLMHQILCAVLKLGIAPDLKLEVNWIPVDAVARMLAEAAHQYPAGERLLLTADHPVRFDHLLDLARSDGNAILVQPVDRWMESLAERAPDQHVLMEAILHPWPGRVAAKYVHRSFKQLTLAPPADDALTQYLRYIKSVVAE